MPSNTPVDVLIVGGNPTGATLALELAIQQIPFRIVDKSPERSDKSRALAMQPRTQELLNRHGDVEGELLQHSTRNVGLAWLVNGKPVVNIEGRDGGMAMTAISTAFPTAALVPQQETERFLDDALAKHGYAVERGLEVDAKSIRQDSDGVNVTLLKADGTEENLRVKYLIGCDGAHSAVRHASNLTFEGSAYSQEFILADCHVEWTDPSLTRRFCISVGTGFMGVIPLPKGMTRIIATRTGAAQKKDDLQLSDFETMIPRFFPGTAKLRDPIWLASFHFHNRGVNKYRDQRLFVAGDAAHIHSPVGGQGMNTGIQDAINLGWKLARVLRGEKPDSFLDSYTEERHPVGQRLLRTTDRFFSFLMNTNPIFVFFRNLVMAWVVPWMLGTESGIHKTYSFASQLGIRYRRSPVVGTAEGFSGLIRGGDRVADRSIEGPVGECYLSSILTPESHHLLLFSGPGNDITSEGTLQRAKDRFLAQTAIRVKVHEIFGKKLDGQSGYSDVEGKLHADFGFDVAGYVLARPDGYVAHIGLLSQFDEFLNWAKSY